MPHSRFAAFLRGMNLGGRRITNDQLAQVVSDLDVRNVGTFLASGNVVFDTDQSDPTALETLLEATLKSGLGYEVDTFVRPCADLPGIAATAYELTPEGDRWKAHVIFLKAALPRAEARALEDLGGPDDQFHLRGREIYWLRNGGLSDCEISDRDLRVAMAHATTTMRTVNTVSRFAAKFCRS